MRISNVDIAFIANQVGKKLVHPNLVLKLAADIRVADAEASNLLYVSSSGMIRLRTIAMKAAGSRPDANNVFIVPGTCCNASGTN